MMNKPSASYGFNNFQEIKSHSAVLYNERMAILFYLLDMRSIEMNTNNDIGKIMEVRALLKQIYKNIRSLIRNNPTMRVTMNLETKDPGMYTTDVAIGIVDKMIEYCEFNSWTLRKVHIVVQHLNQIEIMLKDILQYYHYFVRPDFKQKPDIEIATERYKDMADKLSVEELKAVVGKKHMVDFESLGMTKAGLDKIGIDENYNEPEVPDEFDEKDVALDETPNGDENKV